MRTTPSIKHAQPPPSQLVLPLLHRLTLRSDGVGEDGVGRSGSGRHGEERKRRRRGWGVEGCSVEWALVGLSCARSTPLALTSLADVGCCSSRRRKNKTVNLLEWKAKGLIVYSNGNSTSCAKFYAL